MLKTNTASGKPTTLRRPVQRLYPVEFSLASSTAAAEEVALNSGSIDVLLGADVYWKVVTGQVGVRIMDQWPLQPD